MNFVDYRYGNFYEKEREIYLNSVKDFKNLVVLCEYKYRLEHTVNILYKYFGKNGILYSKDIRFELLKDVVGTETILRKVKEELGSNVKYSPRYYSDNIKLLKRDKYFKPDLRILVGCVSLNAKFLEVVVKSLNGGDDRDDLVERYNFLCELYKSSGDVSYCYSTFNEKYSGIKEINDDENCKI